MRRTDILVANFALWINKESELRANLTAFADYVVRARQSHELQALRLLSMPLWMSGCHPESYPCACFCQFGCVSRGISEAVARNPLWASSLALPGHDEHWDALSRGRGRRPRTPRTCPSSCGATPRCSTSTRRTATTWASTGPGAAARSATTRRPCSWRRTAPCPASAPSCRWAQILGLG